MSLVLCHSEFQILFGLIKAEINPVSSLYLCALYPYCICLISFLWLDNLDRGMDYIRTNLSQSLFTPRFLKQIQTLKRQRKPLLCQSYLHSYLYFWFWFRRGRAKTNKLSFSGNLWHLSTDFSIWPKKNFFVKLVWLKAIQKINILNYSA